MIKCTTVYPPHTLSFNAWAKYIRRQVMKGTKTKKQQR